MAEKSGSKESFVELREKIARSRELVVRDLGGLRYELDFPLKFKKAFQRHTVVWVGGALAFGLLVALLRARTHKVYLSAAGKKVRMPKKALLESGLLLGALRLGVTFLQPVLISYLTKQAAKKSASARSQWGR
ncbi:MAG TPA: hypothetical protein VHW03_05500 [Chthoniobacterales bacterium]|nr:hypothetical protein [Chthoniobacterales bacterium]